MATFYNPLLDPQNYEAFRGLLGNEIPQTFKEWERRVDQRVADRQSKGHATVDVKLNPDEFASYLRARGHKASDHILWRCVADKAMYRDAK